MNSPDWGWHPYAVDPDSPFSYRYAGDGGRGANWWLPSVHTFCHYGAGWVPMGALTLDRYEVGAYIRRMQRQGRAVEVWDACPTCLPTGPAFASGPCTPLTCPIGRPLRGALPRFR